MGVVCRRVKAESQLVHSPSRMDSFILPLSSKVFWGSALLPLFDLGWILRSRLDCYRSTSHCQSTLIASKCDYLDRSMFLLTFLVSPGVFFVLATIGIVDCTFRRQPPPRPVSLFCAWNGCFTFIWTGRNRMEWKRHHFFDCYCMWFRRPLISVEPSLCSRFYIEPISLLNHVEIS